MAKTTKRMMASLVYGDGASERKVGYEPVRTSAASDRGLVKAARRAVGATNASLCGLPLIAVEVDGRRIPVQ